MTPRGSVISIDRSFLTGPSAAGARPIGDGRPALCLLPKNFAQALGAQVVVHGTTKGGSLPARWPTPEMSDLPPEYLEPFEFGKRWDGASARPTAWKTFHLDIVEMKDPVEPRGKVRIGWGEAASDALDALLGNTSTARELLSKDPKNSSHKRKEIHAISPGDILQVGDKRLVVLSNEPIHRLFKFGIVVACPLAGPINSSRSALKPDSIHGRRIAWELTQRLELEFLRFTRGSQWESLPPGEVAILQRKVRHFWSDGIPGNLATEAFQEHLRHCRAERETGAVSACLGTGEATLGRQHIKSEYDVRPGQRHASGGAVDALAGEQIVELEHENRDLRLSIKRSGSRVTAYVEPGRGVSTKVLYVSVGDGEDREVSYVGQDEIAATHGVAKVPLGTVAAGLTLQRRVDVGTTAGRETFDLDLVWNIRQPSR